MGSFRSILSGHRALAATLIALALCLKVLLPVGYMVGAGEQTLTVLVCDPASGSQHVQREITIPMKPEVPETGTAAKGDCAFSSLGMAGIAAGDPWLLALAIAFVLALGFAPLPLPRPRLAPHLRPPLRGPPRAA